MPEKNESETIDPMRPTVSLQKSKFQPCIFRAFVPGKAASNRTDDASQNNAAINPPPYDETPFTPSNPNPAIAPKTPSTPKTSASIGVILTSMSFTFLGKDGALAYQSPSVSIIVPG